MKATDLKFPFPWEERKPAIANRVLFVPDFYEKHQEFVFPQWEDPALFGKKGSVFIEYGSGNGTWIAEKAHKESQVHWVAVEFNFERVRKIWCKQQRQELSNLFVVCGEALTFTLHYLPPASVEGAFINFPDPWPKPRHAKNRLFQPPFVEALARVVKKGGEATVVTDDALYAAQILEEMSKSPSWEPFYGPPHFVTAWPDYGTSYFDTLWRQKGKTIHYFRFVRR